MAWLFTELDVGGAERCLARVASGLDRQHFVSKVFVLSGPPSSSQDQLVGLLQANQIAVEFLGCQRKSQLLRAVSGLKSGLRQFQPHVVQSMLFHANVVTSLAIGASKKIPWCAGLRVADPSRWRQIAERFALLSAQRVVCVSQAVADFARQQLKVLDHKCLVIPNGIDGESLRQAAPIQLTELGLAPGRRGIIFIGRLTEQKGPDDLMKAAPAIFRALPEHDLLMVGDGVLADSLHRMAQESGFADRIRFLGWRPDVAALLNACDLLVLPSRWEGMPNVVLEAMAIGLPVVCTRVEGVTELLGPLGRSQSIPVGHPQLLAQQVVEILLSQSLAADLGASNQQRVAEHFSLQSVLSQYEKLFANVSRRP